MSKGDTLERAKMIFAMAKQMKSLSDKHSLPFVVTNQVTADFQAAPSGLGGGEEGGREGGGVQPALGLSWSNCVHTRFLLMRRDLNNCHLPSLPPSLPPSATTTTGGIGTTTSSSSSSSSSSQWVRQMRLLLSPSLPCDLSCRFVVETAGVRGVGGGGGEGGQH